VTDPLALFLIFLRAAALSVGGQGALPLLKQDLVATGLLTESQVLEALVIGRIAPGPTGLYIVTLGYFAGGPAGAVLALAGALTPPVAMIAIASALRRQLVTAWAAGLVRGVALTASGLLVATAVRLLAPEGSILDVPAWQIALAAVGAASAIRGGIHPGLVVAFGAIAGLVFGR
jgi:chromate transporter